MIDRHVETIFCDDIRQEINGKISYIGVYSGYLFVQQFPVTLPKLCVDIKVVSIGDHPLRSLKLQILKNDETFQDVPIDSSIFEKISKPPGESNSDNLSNRLQVVAFQLIFSPLQIDAPCVLKVIADTEEGTFRGPGLTIEQISKQNGKDQ